MALIHTSRNGTRVGDVHIQETGIRKNGTLGSTGGSLVQELPIITPGWGGALLGLVQGVKRCLSQNLLLINSWIVYLVGGGKYTYDLRDKGMGR